MKKIISILSVLLILFTLTGCGDPVYTMPSNDPSMLETDSDISFGSTGESVTDENLMVITTGWIQIETKTYDQAKEKLYDLVKECGGYFSDTEENTDYNDETGRKDGNRTGYWEIRIPSDKFNQFSDEIDSSMTVVRKSVTNEDVTNQYFETSNYLEVYAAERERILALMEQATEISDLITLENKLTELNYQIDSLKGDLKYIENKVNYTTVNVSIREMNEISVLQSRNFPERFVEQLFNGLLNIQKIFEDIMMWAAYNFVGIIILTIWITVIKSFDKAGFGIGTELHLILVLFSTPILWLIDLHVIAVLVGIFDILFYLIWRAVEGPKKPKKIKEDKAKETKTEEKEPKEKNK